MSAPAPARDRAAAVPSLRRRLSRFVLLLALTWVALASVLQALWVREEVFDLLDDGLVAASEVLAVVLQTRDAAPVAPAPEAGGSERGETRFAWQLVDGEGHVLMHSSRAPAERLSERPVAGLSDGRGGWRVHARPLGDGRWLLVGQSGRERSDESLEVAAGTFIVALFVSLVGLAWLRWRLDRETQPLADLGQVLGRYDPMKRDDVLPPPALLELAPVHQAVQDLGRRLAEHAAAERAFTAHAAHSLRTPLAGLDAQLAVAVREAPPAVQARLARMRGATARLSRVVGALLALFRSSGELRRDPVDVQALLARVPLEGLAVEVAEPVARPRADEDLLAAALMNLLDNAVRHGARKVRVMVHERHVTVADDGPGVDATRLAHLRQALARQDAGLAASEQALTGLGLVLADRVAQVHGGRLELLSAPSGFVVRLWLAPQGPDDGAALHEGAAGFVPARPA